VSGLFGGLCPDIGRFIRKTPDKAISHLKQIGMSRARFTLSYQAQVQSSLLTKADKAALSALFAGDPINRPEALSIIDRSFLPSVE